MLPLLRILVGLATVVTLAATLLLTFLATRVGAVAGKARPEPQQIKLADLLKGGPGDNLHVTLTNFSFGAPIADPFADHWEGAWVPLYAGRRTDGAPPALFYSRRTKSRAELDEILKQETANFLVASSLTDPALKFEPAAQVYTAFPKVDPQKTVVLTEPVLGLSGNHVLGPERWFDPDTSRLCWAAAIGSLLTGIVCVYASYRMHKRAQEEAEERAKNPPKIVSPEDPNVLSVHRFTLERSTFPMIAFGLAMIAMAIIGGVILTVAVDMWQANNEGGVILMGSIGACMVGGFVVLGIKLLKDYCLTIREIAVMNQGIRWLRNNRTYNTPWTEIKSVFKKDLAYVSVGSNMRRGSVHTLTMRLNDGRVLRFNRETLEDYDKFCENVQRLHSHYVVQQKQRELAERGVATFGPISVRSDGIAVGRKQVAWSELEGFEAADGHLKFQAPNAFRFWQNNAIPLCDIPNYIALFEIMRLASGGGVGLVKEQKARTWVAGRPSGVS
jgi:hypothetical protein